MNTKFDYKIKVSLKLISYFGKQFLITNLA